MKAYTTRVGEGPFPSEDAGITDMLHGMGREFGATTGRARRCGWFDAVATRFATMVNGIDSLAVTNLDGLDTVETIKICVAYRLDGKRSTCRRRTTRRSPAASRSTRRCPAGSPDGEGPAFRGPARRGPPVPAKESAR